MIKLELKLFYKTQRELASAINSLIDDYWQNNLSEENLMKSVQELYLNNRQKIIKLGDFTTILKQQCGKRRLDVVERILHIHGLIKDKPSAM